MGTVAVEALGRSGFDWLVLDTEHSPNDVLGVMAQLQVLAAFDLSPVVRIAWNDIVLIKRMLDIGAQTLLVPFIETAEDARRLVSYTRYPPAGLRGVATGHRANQFGRVTDYLATASVGGAVVGGRPVAVHERCGGLRGGR